MTGPTNHLAVELRGILDDLHDSEHGDVPRPLVRERLERLAEQVERLGAEPATAELEAIHAGLEPEQERIAAVLADLDRAMPGWGDVGTHGPDCWVVHAGCLAARIRTTLTGEDHPNA